VALTFSAVIPDVGQATSLVGQLATAVEGVLGDKQMPTGQIADAVSALQNLKIDSPSALVQTGVSQLANLQQIFPEDTQKLLEAFVNELDELTRFIGGNPLVAIVQAGGKLEQGIQAVVAQIRTLADKFKSVASNTSNGLDLNEIMTSLAGVMNALKPLWGTSSATGYADQVIDFFKTKVDGLTRWVAVPTSVSGVLRNLRNAEQVFGAYSIGPLVDDVRGQIAEVKVSIAAIDFSNPTTVEAVRLKLGALVRGQETLRRALASLIDKTAPLLSAVDIVPFTSALGDFVGGLEKITSTSIAKLNIDFDLTTIIHQIHEAIASVDLAKYATDVKGFLQRIDASIDEIDPSIITVPMAEQIEQVTHYLNKLDTAKVAITLEIRKLFESIRQQIEATNLVGVRKQIEDQLKQVSQVIKGQIGQAISAIQSAVNDVLTQIQTAAQALGQLIDPQIREAIESVFGTLLSGLQSIDLPGLLKSAEEQLTSTCEQLSAVDFSIVVDPVVADIQDLKGKLQAIDISLLDGMLKISLEGAVQVIKAVDFKADISDALVAQLEDVISTNLQGFAGVKEKVEAGLDKIKMLKPDALLAAADEPFDTLLAALAELKPSDLLKPLTAAVQSLKDLLAGFSPSRLLAPLTQPLSDLMARLDDFAPSALLTPLQDKVNDALSVLDVLDIGPILDDLKSRLGNVLAGLGNFPLSGALGGAMNLNQTVANSVMGKLDAQKLQTTLETRLLNPLNALLGSLDVNRLLPVFASLQRSIATLSPTALLHQPRQHLQTIGDSLQALQISQLITSLQTGCQGINASLTALHPPASSADSHTALLSLSAQLRPIDVLSGTAAKVDAMKATANQKATQLDQAIQTHTAPLQAVYSALTRLIPGFAAASSNEEAAAAFAAEVSLSLPANAVDELGAIISKIKGLIQDLGLAELMAAANTMSTRVQQKVLALQDLDVLFAPVQAQLDTFKTKIRGFADLSPLTAELDGVFGAVKTQLGALNPATWAASIDGLYQDVCSAVDALPVASMGTQLDQIYADNILQPIGSLKPSVSLKPALDTAFEPVAAILDQISVDKIFEAFQTLIDSLCDQLRTELKKVETAFGEMVSAVPV
jgi:hypothetical protein